MLSSIEQMMLVALSDAGPNLANLAQSAEQINEHIDSMLRYVDTAMQRVDAQDPLHADLIEIREAALAASAKLARFAEESCRPQLWLVP
jgi:hypothetical protein